MNQLPRQVIIIAALFLMGSFVALAQFTGNYLLLSLSFIVPFGAMLLPRLHLVGAAAILFQHSLLKIPLLPFNILLYQICMIVFVGACIVTTAIQKKKVSRPPGWYYSMAFLAVVALIIHVRGFGFLFLRGDTVGGAAYVHLFAAMGLYYYSGMLILTPRQWKIILAGMFLIVIYPVIAYQLALMGTVFPLFFTDVSFGFRQTYFAMEQGIGGDLRLSIFGLLRYLVVVPAILFKPSQRRWGATLFFFVIALIGALASGTRLSVIHVLLFIMFYLFVISKRKNTITFLMLGIGIFLWLGAYLVVDHVPFSFQRALTILPGVEVEGAALRDAQETIRWRQLLWSYAWHEFPQYYFVGQGFAFTVHDYLRGSYLVGSEAWIYHAFVTGDLHLGPFSIVFTYGIPGGLIILSFVVVSVRRHMQLRSEAWSSSELKRYHQVMMTVLAVNGAIYMIAGSARHILPALFLQFATLHALWVSDQNRLCGSEGLDEATEKIRPL